MTRSLKCVLALALALTAPGATFSGADRHSAMEILSALPLTTAELAPAVAVPSWESPGARLAGVAVRLATVSGETLGSIAGVQTDFLKALEKVELPVAPAVGSGFSAGGRELPWATVVAFAGGVVMLLALCLFGGALLKMSLDDSRKARRLRRRYAP